MFKTKYYILLTGLFFIALLCNSCKKYPQDEHYTLRSIANRITGTYILDKYIVNGIDSTCLIPPCIARNDLKYGKADGNYYFLFNHPYNKGNITGMNGGGNYLYGKVYNNYKDLILNYKVFTGEKNVLVPTKNSEERWQIKKLTKTEFWFTLASSNFTFEVHLKKIHTL